LLGAAAAAPALALPTLGRAQEPDPVFALIAEWRAEGKRLDGEITDADMDCRHYGDLTDRLYRAVPTTIAGPATLTAIFRQEAEWNDDAELWLDTIGTTLRKLMESGHA
jgi:hypothetical protein